MWVWLVIAVLVLALIFGRTSKESFYIENNTPTGVKFIRLMNTDYDETNNSVDILPGWQGTVINPSGSPQGQTELTCRVQALANPDLYDAWGFRNSNHPEARWRNTCFFIAKNTLGTVRPNNADNIHTIGCLNPSGKLFTGCACNRYIQIAHLDAFNAAGTNVTTGRTVTASPALAGSATAASVVQGTSTANSWPAIYHSATCKGDEFWEVQLTNPETLSRIVFYNRTDAGQDRALFYNLQLLDANRKQLAVVPFTASSNIMTFYIDKLVGAAPSGPKGDPGTPGTPGAPGATGAKGDKGDVGTQGITGANGAVGPTGPTGPTGLTGKDGIPGPEGKQGVPGPYGLRGDVGPTGAIGPKGPKGDQGPMGMDALEEGADGTYDKTSLGSSKYPYA